MCCTRGRANGCVYSFKAATGKRTAAASGVDSRVHAGAVYSDRAAWCRLNAPMEAGQLIPESRALLARNALFHPDDAHFCFWVQVELWVCFLGRNTRTLNLSTLNCGSRASSV